VNVDAGFLAPQVRTPTHGYEAMREAAMAAFAKTWRREAATRKSLPGPPRSRGFSVALIPIHETDA
jgi:hypothetical protein